MTTNSISDIEAGIDGNFSGFYPEKGWGVAQTKIKFIFAAVTMSVLVACGGPIASNELQIDNDGSGRFSGHAGEDWTPEELRDQVAGVVCNGVTPRVFNPSILDGKNLFSGSC